MWALTKSLLTLLTVPSILAAGNVSDIVFRLFTRFVSKWQQVKDSTGKLWNERLISVNVQCAITTVCTGRIKTIHFFDNIKWLAVNVCVGQSHFPRTLKDKAMKLLNQCLCGYYARFESLKFNRIEENINSKNHVQKSPSLFTIGTLKTIPFLQDFYWDERMWLWGLIRP